MKLRNGWIFMGLIVAGLQLAACAPSPQVRASVSESEPGYAEPIAGTKLNRVVLVEKAAQRLGIQTVPVRVEQVNGTRRMVIPYSAVIYDLHGETWLYTNPDGLTFVRQPIIVDHIAGDMAVLVVGPATGTKVVTVGVAELYGIDTGLGK